MELFSPGHLIPLLVVAAVLFFGWKQLPDMAKSVGKSLRVFRTEVKGLSDEDATAAAKDAVTAVKDPGPDAIASSDAAPLPPAPVVPAAAAPASESTPPASTPPAPTPTASTPPVPPAFTDEVAAETPKSSSASS